MDMNNPYGHPNYNPSAGGYPPNMPPSPYGYPPMQYPGSPQYPPHMYPGMPYPPQQMPPGYPHHQYPQGQPYPQHPYMSPQHPHMVGRQFSQERSPGARSNDSTNSPNPVSDFVLIYFFFFFFIRREVHPQFLLFVLELFKNHKIVLYV
jgi:hypothetical protein